MKTENLISIERYKDIVSIRIDEKYLEHFYSLFKKRENVVIIDNDMKLQFMFTEKSEININNLHIVISIDEKRFYAIQELLEDYIDSDRTFPLDISLELLEFSIQPIEIVDVVFECGNFIEQNQ